MTLGNLLASKRKTSNLTQQQVGDALNVSPQAVSKWENDLAQPDLASLKRLAELYNVPVSQLIDATDEPSSEEPAPAPESAPAQQPTSETPQKPVLAVCEDCNKPIYEGNDVVRRIQHHGRTAVKVVYCTVCAKKRDRRQAENELQEAQTAKKRAIGWGIFFAIAVGVSFAFVPQIRFWSILLAACAFCLTSCIFLDESFVGEMWSDMISWSFHAPGVIFTLDLDGITWLIAVKLLFWIIGALFAVAAFLFGTAVGMILAPFAVTYDYRVNAKTIKELQQKINEANAVINKSNKITK